MRHPYLTKRKADSVARGVFLISLGILFYTQTWWPGIIFALGLTFIVRNYLTGRKFDLLLTLMICGVLSLVTLSFMLLLPLILIGSGVYFIGREFFSKDILVIKKNAEWKKPYDGYDW